MSQLPPYRLYTGATFLAGGIFSGLGKQGNSPVYFSMKEKSHSASNCFLTIIIARKPKSPV
jgi:hypothetical protein